MNGINLAIGKTAKQQLLDTTPIVPPCAQLLLVYFSA
jgi:hypothetical protein